ncbi:hypothetical protein PVAG01_11301 [Phlyctema vagabunda]|uniref:Uncharacterized protein n=1 Tax=Phlyctema vagabunda TaxID=108571 RepID=A0ABR4P1W9_9HELO
MASRLADPLLHYLALTISPYPHHCVQWYRTQYESTYLVTPPGALGSNPEQQTSTAQGETGREKKRSGKSEAGRNDESEHVTRSAGDDDNATRPGSMRDLKKILEEQINSCKKESDVKPVFPDFGFVVAKSASHQPSHASTEFLSPRRGRSRRRSSTVQRSSNSSARSRGRRGSFPWAGREANEVPSTPDIESPSSVQNINPPRPAKDGFEWVWFPEGYWAEREVAEVTRRKRPWFTHRSSSGKVPLFSPRAGDEVGSIRSPRSTKNKTTSIRSTSRPQSEMVQNSPVGDQLGSKSATPTSIRGSPSFQKPQIVIHEAEPRHNVFLRSLQMLSPSIQRLETDERGDLSAFYHKTRRKLRLLRKAKQGKTQDSEVTPSVGEDRLQSRTTMLLEATAGYFDRVQTKKHQSILAASPVTSSPDSKGSRRRFGLAPWHRRDSHDTLISVTTTLHNLLMGNTPAVSPVSSTKATDEKRNRVVDMTDPLQDSFLPTEARRVKTPPLPRITPTGQQRGFFFEIPPQNEDAVTPGIPIKSSPLTLSVPSPSMRGVKKHRISPPGGRDYHDSNANSSTRALKSPGNRNRLSEQSQGHFSRAFELNMPEHLSTSPLCPANLFHPSGGTGICPYHGRRRKPTVASFESVDSVEILLRLA